MNNNNSHHSGHCLIPTKGDGCSLSGLVGFSVMEIWKGIKGYEQYYQVSNLGRVRTISRLIKRNGKGDFILKARILKQQVSTKGYWNVRVCVDSVQKTLSVHRQIGFAFIPNPENKPQINHKNTIKSDNSITNLEWVTNAENQAHAIRMGITKDKSLGEKNGRATLTESDVRDIRYAIYKGVARKFLPQVYNLKYTTICKVVTGELWGHVEHPVTHRPFIGRRLIYILNNGLEQVYFDNLANEKEL